MDKKSAALIVGALGIGMAALFVATNEDALRHKVDIRNIDARLTYDPENVVDVASTFSDIFIGRVIAMNGVQNPDGIVQTQYSVDVLKPLKGDLKGRIIVSQLGGYFDGSRYVFNAETSGNSAVKSSPDANDLKSGKTYLFATLPNEKMGWHVVSTSYYGRAELMVDENLTGEDAVSMAVSDATVKKMKEAIGRQ